MRSSELSRLDAVTAAVAASTTEVIWELVRVLERVLLVLRDETLACLELLVEERLALSSRITVEAREVVVVPVSVVPVSDVVEEEPPSSLPPPQPITMNNDSRRTENENRFEKLPFLTLLDLKINLPILSFFKGFFNGLFSINGCLSCRNSSAIPNKTICQVFYRLHYSDSFIDY